MRCRSRKRAPPPGCSRRSTSTTCRGRGAGGLACIAPGRSSKWRARSSGARKRIGRRRWQRRWRRRGIAWGEQRARPTVPATSRAGAGAVARGVPRRRPGRHDDRHHHRHRHWARQPAARRSARGGGFARVPDLAPRHDRCARAVHHRVPRRRRTVRSHDPLHRHGAGHRQRRAPGGRGPARSQRANGRVGRRARGRDRQCPARLPLGGARGTGRGGAQPVRGPGGAPAGRRARPEDGGHPRARCPGARRHGFDGGRLLGCGPAPHGERDHAGWSVPRRGQRAAGCPPLDPRRHKQLRRGPGPVLRRPRRHNAVAFLRFDWKASEAQTLTLRLDGRWDSQQPTRVSPLGLPPTGGTRTERGGGVMASLTSHFAGSLINEVRGYFSTERRDATALVAVPAGRVQVASDLPDGRQGVATLGFGGNAGLPQRVDNVSLELSEELSWLPGGGAHRPKLGGLLSGTGLDQNQTPNQLGTFVFPSLSALAADSPASFSRVFAPVVQGGTAWNGALYLADSWRTGGLQLTYGTRLEAARFSGAPPYNRAVDSLFALRTDRIPEHTRLSPRIGFMWTGGGGEDGGPTILRGGVGDFQSPTPTALYSAALGAPGLSNAETELVCIGAAVPIPDWAAYASDPSTIPGQCADTGSTVAISPHPNVTAFARDYAPPHAWRASLGVQRRLLHAFTVSLDASYARGPTHFRSP